MLPENNVQYDYEKYKNDLILYGKNKGFVLNLDNPKTLNDKINWIKIHPTPLKSFCADKIKVHNYCKEILGEDICIPILKIYSSAKDIKWNELPKQCVIKCNHGCAYNIVSTNINSLDKNLTISKLNKWMSIDFSNVAGYEMQYHNIDHKIFVEKYMGKIADYKFWCFNGKVKFWTYSEPNNGQPATYINYYDIDGNLTDICNEVHPRNDKIKISIPQSLEKMIEISENLAKNFDFVRVDLYEINNKIYLGELTFTPGAGWFKFGKDNEMLGNLLILNTI